jgi:hypothetical protein
MNFKFSEGFEDFGKAISSNLKNSAKSVSMSFPLESKSSDLVRILIASLIISGVSTVAL